MTGLIAAYAANIPSPIAIPTIFQIYPADRNRFQESSGWRILVRHYWKGILVLSILEWFQALRYSPVLLLQLIYKITWLAEYGSPQKIRRDYVLILWGIAVSLIGIVVVWLIILSWN